VTTPGPAWPDDLGDVAASDALLDGLGAGCPIDAAQSGPGDPALTALLASWRRELDDHATTLMTSPPVAAPSRPSRWVRAHQRTAAATAVVVAIATSTGVAAAADGPTGPLGGLHRLMFGESRTVHLVDRQAIEAQGLLQKARGLINRAHDAGSIGAAARDRVSGDLDQADRLLTQDSHAPRSLLNRLNELRTTLAAIPLAAPKPVVSDNRGHGGSGRDDTGAEDRHGRGSGDNQGEDRSGDEGGSSGSGSGSGSGSDDQSGDQGSGGSGSDDGTSQGSTSRGSDDGSGSGSGSDDQSGDQGSGDSGSSGGGDGSGHD
jgi:hypothetical protein